jgi:hypothetical protein
MKQFAEAVSGSEGNGCCVRSVTSAPPVESVIDHQLSSVIGGINITCQHPR